MLAVKSRRSSDYVARPQPVELRIADAAAGPGVASPARLMQAELAARLTPDKGPASTPSGISLRGRAALICASALVCWLPVAAAVWIVVV